MDFVNQGTNIDASDTLTHSEAIIFEIDPYHPDYYASSCGYLERQYGLY